MCLHSIKPLFKRVWINSPESFTQAVTQPIAKRPLKYTQTLCCFTESIIEKLPHFTGYIPANIKRETSPLAVFETETSGAILTH